MYVELKTDHLIEKVLEEELQIITKEKIFKIPIIAFVNNLNLNRTELSEKQSNIYLEKTQSHKNST